jgi:GNAT superfamily N-acetyltransferase
MLSLRAANENDIPDLRALIEVSVRALSDRIYSPSQIEAALAEMFGVDTQLIEDGTYYVIEEGSTIVAAGGWSARQTLYGGDQAKREEDSILDPSTTPARIRAFFVHPAWTRRGLARRLFNECETAAREKGFRSFELAATLPGIPLYRAIGFTAVEEISIPLSGNQVLPCLRMRRSIGS